MLYRQAGKPIKGSSILGFGCMRLPILDGKPNLIDEEKAKAMVGSDSVHVEGSGAGV